MKPRILILDIETAPIEAYVWGLWDNNVSVNQIKKDWFILSWAAKWLGEKRVMQTDLRKGTGRSQIDEVKLEKKLLRGMWKLLNAADIVVTQNGKAFDIKKLYARFIIHGIRPPSSFQHIDTKLLAKRVFGFTSNSLEYMAKALKLRYKKLSHEKYPGQELWTECLKGNKKAWAEMRKYNIMDVLALEELYNRLIPWDSPINFNVYYGPEGATCSCGCKVFLKNGYCYTSVGKYQRYCCKKCGAELRVRTNLYGKSVKFVGVRR